VELGAGEILLLAGAGLIAGAVNAVAGGGSLISFPALLAVGYAALDANATNIVALVPGYVGGVLAYRQELSGQRERVKRLSAVSVLGGAGGAVLLLLSPPGVFEALVPSSCSPAARCWRSSRWCPRRRAGRAGRTGVGRSPRPSSPPFTAATSAPRWG